MTSHLSRPTCTQEVTLTQIIMTFVDVVVVFRDETHTKYRKITFA